MTSDPQRFTASGARSRLRWSIPALLAMAIGQPGGAWAHHSFSMFDSSQCREVAGTVRAMEWNFPHSWLWVMVPDGQPGAGVWGFEGDSPALLRSKGWERNSLKPGDKVTVRYAPLRNGKQGGAYGLVITADGNALRGTLNASLCWPATSEAQSR